MERSYHPWQLVPVWKGKDGVSTPVWKLLLMRMSLQLYQALIQCGDEAVSRSTPIT